ncbi:MAG: hypothetical protein WDZ74_02175 [Candidatus Paceibacterota bacterium]
MVDTHLAEQKHKETDALQDLLRTRDALTRRLFLVALENLAVFGVPAGIAVYVGIQTGNILLPLLVALVFSWSVFFVRFRTILREAKRIEKEIEDERGRLGIVEPQNTGQN